MIRKHNTHIWREVPLKHWWSRAKPECEQWVKPVSATLDGTCWQMSFNALVTIIALVLGLAIVLPVHAASSVHVVLDSFHEVLEDAPWDFRTSSFTLDGDNLGIGQHFTTGPNPSGYFLDEIVVRTEGRRLTGMSIWAGVYNVNDDGTRGSPVVTLSHSNLVPEHNRYKFYPPDGSLVLLPETTYLFIIVCLANCDGNSYIDFSRTNHNTDNSRDIYGDLCEEGGGRIRTCWFYPSHHFWTLENYHVRREDNWVYDGEETASMLIEVKVKYRYEPATPTNISAVSDSLAPGRVNLTWTSPPPPVTSITRIVDCEGIDCPLTRTLPSATAEAVTHHEYRYKLSGTSADWGDWTAMPFSAVGHAYENQYTVSELANGVAYDFQVRAVNGDGGGPPSDVVSVEVGTGHGICDRTPAVRDAILARISEAADCGQVTLVHLSQDTGRLVIRTSYLTLKQGDFDGLISLTSLDLSRTSLKTVPYVFNDLTSLTNLNLSNNDLTELPAGLLNSLTALETLFLNDNDLTELPPRIFNRLTALKRLNLNDNELAGNSFEIGGIEYSELPTLHQLTALEEISLRGNGLDDSHLQRSFDLGDNPGPVGIFKGLSALHTIDLSGNVFTTLPDGIFSGLTNLRALHLYGNPGECISGSQDICLDVFLALDEQSRVKVRVPTGAPFDIRIPFSVKNGSIEGGEKTLSVPTGAVESAPLMVIQTRRSAVDPVVEIDSLPSPPLRNTGYQLRDNSEQPLLIPLPANATGAPTISGTARVGKTLTAGQGTIADIDGLPATSFPAGYTFQWVRVDGITETEISSATTSTYTLVPADEDLKVKVKVYFTDAADNAEGPLTSAAYPLTNAVAAADTTAPTVSSATVHGRSLVITFNETLAAVANLASSDFAVKKTSAGSEQMVDLSGSPAIRGATVALTLATAVTVTDTDVKVSYTRPVLDDDNRLEDADGNEVADFTDRAVTNVTGDTTAPVFSSATVDKTSLVIAFTETLAAAADLDNTVFVVKKTPSGDIEQTVGLSGSPSINGATVTLTLAAAVVSSDTGVKVSYTIPVTDNNNRLEDAAGNDVDSFTDQAVLNTARNSAATGKPAITGTAQVGETLTVGKGTIADTDGTTRADSTTPGFAYSYQWVRVDSDGVSNATEVGSDQDSYVLAAADVGKKIRVLVSFTDDLGYTEGPLTSAAWPSAGTITDDGPPTLSITDASGDEGDERIYFTIKLSKTHTAYVRVRYSTSVASGQTATSGTDFSATSGSTSIAPGLTTRTISVRVTNDVIAETDETFTVTLSDPSTNALLGTMKSAVGTILDDDGLPRLSIADASGAEDDERVDETVDFTVTLSEILMDDVTVNYSTSVASGQTATSGTDFTAATDSTATITAGNTTTGISIPIVDDAVDEIDETFTVTLSDPSSNARLGPMKSAVGTILDDDHLPTVVSATVDGSDLEITFTETLAAAANLTNSAFAVKKTPAGSNEETVSLVGPTSISGATVTLTLATAVAHTDTLVKVSYSKPVTDNNNRLEDANGNEVASFINWAVTNDTADTTAPEFSSAKVVESTLEITFTEALATAANLANNAFVVKKTPAGGNEETVSLGGPPSIRGATVTLNLNPAVVHSDTDVKVSYTIPQTDDYNRLEDADGNEVASFTNRAVTNTTVDTTVPTVSSATVDESELVIIFTETLAAAANLANNAFAVKKMPAGGNEETVSLGGTPTISGDAVTLTLATAVVHTDTDVKVSYTKPQTDDNNRLEDPADNEVASFTDLAVTNITSDNNAATGAPAISGTARVSETLTAEQGTIADTDGLPATSFPTGYTFQWVRVDDGTDAEISGATSSTYKLVEADQGKQMKVKVSFRDNAGNDEGPLTSAAWPAVGAVAAGNATGAPTISGTARVGETLTADTGAIMDADGKTMAEAGDAGYAYSYQWFRVDSDGVSNATGVGLDQDMYELVAADAGKKIRVQVSFTDDADNAEGPLTSATWPVVGSILTGNATGAPTISGTARVGETLTADISAIMDVDGQTMAEAGDAGYAYSYQWFRVDSDGVSNATGVGLDQDMYELVAADAGKKIRVQVSFTDDADNAEGPLTSATYPVVGSILAGNATGAPTISGTARVGETLTADTGAIMDTDGKTMAEAGDAGYAYSYQWFRVDSDGVSNATGVGLDQDMYELVAADAGKKIRVQVSFTDDADNAEGPLTSAAWPVVGAVTPPELTANFIPVEQSVKEGEKAVVTLRIVVSQQPEDIVSYRVHTRDGTAISSDDYTPVMPNNEEVLIDDFTVQDDGSYKYERTYELSTLADTDVEGEETFYFKLGELFVMGHSHYSTTIEGDEKGALIRIIEPATGQPVITGTAQVGNSLTAGKGTIADTDGTSRADNGDTGYAYSYQWVRVDGVTDADISDATSSTYKLLTADMGKKLKVKVWFKDDAGYPEGPLISDAYPETKSVKAANNTATGKPAISGTARVGETLTAGKGTLADADGLPTTTFPTGYNFQWVRVDSDGVSNATEVGSDQDSYELVEADAGKKIRVQVSFTDDEGNGEGPLTSAAYPSIETILTAGNATGAPTISGTARVGRTLMAGKGTIADADGLPTTTFPTGYNFQWVRVDSDGVSNATEVGLDQDSYQLVEADEDKKIRVQVSFTDDEGNDEGPLTSAAYPSVDTIAEADTTAPVVTGATVDGTALVITFDETLAAASGLANSAFAVTKNASAETVSLTGTPTVSGATVSLTLATAVVHTDTDVKVSYSKPETDNNNRLEDGDGNEVASFTDQAVVNDTGDTTAPVVTGATVDGTALVITFDETLASASGLANSAFAVTKNASAETVSLTGTPTVSGATVSLTLAAAVVHTDTDVKVSYSKPETDNNNRLEDGDGNEVASFTDQAVVNDTGDTTAPVVTGATVDGTALVITFDETLAAASGLANSAFAVTKNASAETVSLTGTPTVSGATVSLTLASAVVHTDTDVKVSYSKPVTDNNNRLEDGDGNEVASFTDQAVVNDTGDTTAPVVTGATVDGTALVITFDETLAAASGLANSAFAVTKNASAETVSLTGTPTVSGATVSLTLAAAVVHTDTDVKVSYSKPETDNNNRLEDGDGNEVASFTDQAVVNDTGDTTAPVVTGATVDGTALVITFDETLAAASGLANSAFAVTKNAAAETVSLTGTPTVSGATVSLTLAAAVVHTDTDVKVSYSKPETDNNNRLEDGDGNEVASFTDQAVVNDTGDTTAPVVTGATVDGTALVITFDETLAAASGLANSAFAVTKNASAETVSLTGTPTVSGATVSLTLAAAVVHTDTDVKVSYSKPETDNNNRLEDGDGNEVASFTDQAVVNDTGDTTAPVVTGATVDGTALVITFDETLAAASGLANSAFAVTKNAAAETVSLTGTPTVSGATVSLTLAAAVVHTDTDVKVSYSKPETDNNNRLEDGDGNEVASFTDQAVVNDTGDTTAPVVTGATVDGTALVITFDETLAAASGLANSAFAVTKNASAETVSLTGTPTVSGATVSLTLASAVVHTDTLVKVSYSKPVTDNNNRLEDGDGNEVASFTDQAVVNDTGDTTAPVVTGATVDGTALVISFDETLAAASGLANSAFAVTKNASAETVSLTGTPTVSGATVSLTLASAVVHTDTDVKVSYSKPVTDNNNRLEDGDGNEVASFTDQAVVNDTGDTTAPVVTGATVDGTALVITFDETLAAASGLANSAFAVTKNASAETVSLTGTPTVSGATVSLTLAAAVVHTDTDVKVSYSKPETDNNNRLEDGDGNEVASFTDQAVVNDTGDTGAGGDRGDGGRDGPGDYLR